MPLLDPAEQSLTELGWAALPAHYRIPDTIPSLEEARRYCRDLAQAHYENFHVASWFLPEKLRPHFYSIYAYCRIADDLGDEVTDPGQALALLAAWERELEACYAGHCRHPVFVALRPTILACGIPKAPFSDLLKAFRQDQTVKRYATIEEVLGYCQNSANPVGRLVLYACGEATEERFVLSDATCSALQLANFWQDVRRDYAIGRVYLPQEDMARFGVSDADIAAGVATPGFKDLLRYEVEYTRRLFARGAPLIDQVGPELSRDLDLFNRGGLAILDAIERQGFDVMRSRPRLSKRAKLGLALRALGAKVLPGRRTGRTATHAQ